MNWIIDYIILSYWNYSEEVLNKLSNIISAFTMLSKAQDNIYFKSIEAFFNKKYTQCKKLLKEFIQKTKTIKNNRITYHTLKLIQNIHMQRIISHIYNTKQNNFRNPLTYTKSALMKK